MKKPSASQARVLAAINHLSTKYGRPPSRDEIAKEVGVNKPSVQAALLRLQKAGQVQWEKGAARTLRAVGQAKPIGTDAMLLDIQIRLGRIEQALIAMQVRFAAPPILVDRAQVNGKSAS